MNGYNTRLTVRVHKWMRETAVKYALHDILQLLFSIAS